MATRKAAFFDRDGILNEVVIRDGKVGSPRSLSEFQLKPGAKELVSASISLGYLPIVVTNQPDIEDGFVSNEVIAEMHNLLRSEFRIGVIEVCKSHDNSHPRRKPNPGMLFDARDKYNLDLSQSLIIGDSIKDIGAGKNAGVKTILLQTEYNKEVHGKADFNCDSMSEIQSLLTKKSSSSDTFVPTFLKETIEVVEGLNIDAIEKIALELLACRNSGGRLFVIGSGGGAGHASHAVCDFRKLCGFEAYCPTDNVSELTARVNDDGWETSLSAWLSGSRLGEKDCLLVFSVGGGDAERNVSSNLVKAIEFAKNNGATVLGIVGRDGGFTAKNANACIVVPTVDQGRVTAHTEAFQAVLWHLLVSHPLLQIKPTKWQSEEANTASQQTQSTKLLKVKLFADGADLTSMRELAQNPMISGFTTNPTLMRKAGISDYAQFSKNVLKFITDRPVSFEVFSDDFSEMRLQALEISSWGENVYVKIPITNTKGESSAPLIADLTSRGIKVNVTAIMTIEQVKEVLPALHKDIPAYVSVFAGRIADTGVDPLPLMKETLSNLKAYPNVELIWASPRELLNLFQADDIGCHIITMTNDLIAKLSLVGKNLIDYSLDTVKMFYKDASASGFHIEVEKTPLHDSANPASF